jgi:hypothetical protein
VLERFNPNLLNEMRFFARVRLLMANTLFTSVSGPRIVSIGAAIEVFVSSSMFLAVATLLPQSASYCQASGLSSEPLIAVK